MIERIFSEMPPRPSRLARKEIASGRAFQGALDLLGYGADRALGDRADRVEDRVDELHDLRAAFDDEHDDVVDRLARLDERGRGVEEAR